VVGLATSAAVLAVSATRHSPAEGRASAAHSPAVVATANHHVRDTANELVKAPVRIADAAVVRLLRPGDRVDVLAAARVVASAVTVVAVPPPQSDLSDQVAPDGSGLPPSGADAGGAGGALVVLAVSRHTAATLSGAAASSPLAVTLC
jgi:hypothetical protein